MSHGRLGEDGSEQPGRRARDTAGTSAGGAAAAVERAAFERRDGESWARIEGFDGRPPFLMNVPTDTDLWMFLSSAGGLTAGRRDPDGALFPYDTVDRLHDAHHHTGPVTLVRVRRGARAARVWEPFAERDLPAPGIARTLRKNATGNRVEFEEIDRDAALAFRYRWSGSDATGWVRTACLENLGGEPVELAVLDGLRNLLPSGVPLALMQHSSCLVDAYKRVDVDAATGLATIALTARISDRPEPAEELRASVAWCAGLPGARVTLAADAARRFRRGEPFAAETASKGRRGHYFVHATRTLEPGATLEWHLGIDTGRSHADVARLRARLAQPERAVAWIHDSLRSATENLQRVVGSADGLQFTARDETHVHHFANVLFNVLRGGVFLRNHAIPVADFTSFLHTRNRALAARHAARLADTPETIEIAALHRIAEESGDPDFRRIALEYLPLYFGRRHGDPSRPWNRFAIRVRNTDGSQALRFEGNWRDVFQNWEALTRSFPGFLPGVIARFLNGSTADGFNPYRITRDGVEWEVLDPDHPWSGIGYWGDHQVVYLLRLLESLRDHFPGALEEMLGQEIFGYADVPYRLKRHREMLVTPRATIQFDRERDRLVASRVAANGNDGTLLHDADGRVHRASLAEKLLVPALAKLSCLVPEGGIWMNTERPEWNDANNALVGSGLSVVTANHLRRYLAFVETLVAGTPAATWPVAAEVVEWLRRVRGTLERRRGELAAPLDDAARMAWMHELGEAFSDYRERLYAHGLSGTLPLAGDEIAATCRLACEALDHTLRANRRPDALHHAYNLLETDAGFTRAAVRPLSLMLEGQVAALASGTLPAADATRTVEGLFHSPLHRADQDSFMLYPDRELPAFTARNHVPDDAAARVPLVAELLAAGVGSVLERDAEGVLRFHPDFHGAPDLAAALDRLATEPLWAAPVARDRAAMLELFEATFHHRTFTGRSGTMYAYEGLGSIYWHMVAKLLLAVQESEREARERGDDASVTESLRRQYFRIREGLGYAKPASVYGAFPTDPYSHTPAGAGAQQPGMTGQVKEEILTRFGELGLRLREGLVAFEPVLLRREEFLAEPAPFAYFDAGGRACTLEVPRGGLAFTYCGVPVVYTRTRGAAGVRITRANGEQAERPGNVLPAAESAELLARSGTITRIDVGIPEDALRD